MTTATAPNRHARTNATPQREHPLGTREKRTALNYALRAKGIPAKACSKCLTIKSTSEYNKKRTASDGLDSYCRECAARTHARRMKDDPAYREGHRSHSRESARRLYPVKRALLNQQVRQRRASYVAANASRVQDPTVLRRCHGQCGQLLPETEFHLDRGKRDGLRSRCIVCSAAWRRARRACLDAYGEPIGQICYLCGEQITETCDPWVDHVMPQSQGGPDTADNLRWTHGPCNVQRQDRPLTPAQTQRYNATARSGAAQ